jgi:hypothetical protein
VRAGPDRLRIKRGGDHALEHTDHPARSSAFSRVRTGRAAPPADVAAAAPAGARVHQFATAGWEAPWCAGAAEWTFELMTTVRTYRLSLRFANTVHDGWTEFAEGTAFSGAITLKPTSG